MIRLQQPPRAEESWTTGDDDVDMEISLASDGNAQESSGAGYNLRPRSGLALPERLPF